MTNWKPHSDKQERAIESTKRIVLCGTGIQWGKTEVGAIKMCIAAATYRDPQDTFIVTAPTYKILQQSTLPTFLEFAKKCKLGRYHKGAAEFDVHGGGTIYFRTATDPDSIVGIRRCRFIHADEAGLYPLYFWENIQGRAAPMEAQICLTTSPYSLNWVYQELIKPFQRGGKGRPDVELIQARSDENPYFPKTEYERRKRTMDARRFNMMFGGRWERMEGLVYDCFDEHENVIEPYKLPDGTKYVAGIDWGYTDPFVLVVRAITPAGYHYQVSEFYKTGLTLNDMVTVAKQKQAIYGISRFYADPSQPGYIEEFNRNGLITVEANNDVRLGIDVHYELMKMRRFQIFKDSSPHTMDELEMYHWPDPEDLKPDQDAKERNPVKQHDHCMDAIRYTTAMTYKRHEVKLTPRILDEAPETHETHQKRFERLRKKPTYHDEEFR